MINRREKIREYIRNKTIQLIKDEKINDNGIEAEDISYDLKIDRANVSRELNSLWKNGELIKIAGRPVFYLDSKVISNTFPESYIPTFIPKEEHLSDYINSANTYQSPYDRRFPRRSHTQSKSRYRLPALRIAYTDHRQFRNRKINACGFNGRIRDQKRIQE